MGDEYTVEQFMRFALYHPEVGYYSRHIRGIGRRGDFTTAPGLSPLLGRAAAHWALSLRGNGGLLRPWNLIEIGAGDGALAESICAALCPLARARLTYHIVEISPPLREMQRRRLRAGRFRWHGEVASALAASRGRATLIANELVDAFPATQWMWSGGRWYEIGVRLTASGPEEILLEPDPARIRRWCPDGFPGLDRPAEGARIEMHPAFAEWFASWLPGLLSGAILIIDYGGEKLRPRPGGSLRAFWHHQALRGTDVFLRPGRQDITADVDMDQVRRWGEAHGLRTASHTPLATFLDRWHTLGNRDPVAAALADPAGVGTAFRVLDQRREAAP